MPIKINFQNHTEHAAMREIVQLFSSSYEAFHQSESCANSGYWARVYEVAPKFYANPPTVYLSLDRPLSQDTFRGVVSDGEVVVSSWLEWKGNEIRLTELKVASENARREMKRQLYFALKQVTGIKWPWGALTGIRPSQVAMKVFKDQAGDLGQARQVLTDFFDLDPAKANKVLETGQIEEELLGQLNPRDYLVYVGIPFCPSRCSYCSFIAQDAYRHGTGLSEYTEALCAEIRHTFRALDGKVSCLYIGGGTPTSLSAQDLAKLLDTLKSELNLRKDAEICIEAGRADTIDEPKLKLMKDFGTTRLCINPQSLNDDTLKLIGRKHTVASVYEAMDLARKLSFDNINMDFILGLPGEDSTSFIEGITKAIELGAEGITLHSLAFKRSAWLEEVLAREEAGELLLPNADLAESLDEAEIKLRASNYRPYYLYRQKQVRAGLENTGFALSGKECLYNVGMMSDRMNVIGLGSGSSSKRIIDGRMAKLYNSKDLGDYQHRIVEIAQKKLDFFS